MTCVEYPPLLSKLIDGELSITEYSDIENHLSCCEDCRLHYRHLRHQTMLLRGFLRRHALDEGFVRRVRSVIHPGGAIANPAA